MPNLSIVTPGGCNANCKFCFWEQKQTPEDYYINLSNSLIKAKKLYLNELSITGGEPTISTYLVEILKAVKMYSFKKVVLTTNGIQLKDKLPYMKGVVNHINISRHHFSDSKNNLAFGSRLQLSTKQLKSTIEQCNKNGIDVTLNCVIDEYNDKPFLLDMINFAKKVGATSITFRKDIAFNSLELTERTLFSNYENIDTSKCPVCRSETIMVSGIYVTFKTAVKEPSDTLEAYEYIIQQNGELTTDWEGKKVYKEPKRVERPMSSVPCGGYTHKGTC